MVGNKTRRQIQTFFQTGPVVMFKNQRLDLSV